MNQKKPIVIGSTPAKPNKGIKYGGCGCGKKIPRK